MPKAYAVVAYRSISDPQNDYNPFRREVQYGLDGSCQHRRPNDRMCAFLDATETRGAERLRSRLCDRLAIELIQRQ